MMARYGATLDPHPPNTTCHPDVHPPGPGRNQRFRPGPVRLTPHRIPPVPVFLVVFRFQSAIHSTLLLRFVNLLPHLTGWNDEHPGFAFKYLSADDDIFRSTIVQVATYRNRVPFTQRCHQNRMGLRGIDHKSPHLIPLHFFKLAGHSSFFCTTHSTHLPLCISSSWQGIPASSKQLITHIIKPCISDNLPEWLVLTDPSDNLPGWLACTSRPLSYEISAP
jgi:hypothetical protein